MLLALILTSKEQGRGIRSPTLVVAKLSLLPQWEEEIKTKTNLTYCVYYGSQGARNTMHDFAAVDVVLTTYGTIQGELKRKNPVLLPTPWLRVILDEA
jgi:DNA repair protein RAD5